MILNGSPKGRPFFMEKTMYIYESPDKGKTIYVREFGKLERVTLEEHKAAREARELGAKSLPNEPVYEVID